MFRVSTWRDVEPELVVDASHSNFCERISVDGTVVPADNRCEDHIQYKTAAVSSGHIAVRIEPTRSMQTASLVR